jgi:nucleotide-binding universal stress UspA family protein
MKTNKYKIVVLTDLKNSDLKELESAVSLAKMIKGEVHIFHVKKSIDLVKKESQLTAIRSINENFKEIENKLKDLKNYIFKEFNFSIDYSFSIGNINEEIEDYLNQMNPDIIVLGKKKKNILRIIGDNVTEYVLKNHQGAILIADEKNSLQSKNELSIGLLNDCKEPVNLKFASELIEYAKTPLTSYHITDSKDTTILKENNLKTINYVFEKSDNSIKTLSKYLSKNDINLLCVDRAIKGKAKKKFSANNFKELINELPVNLLISSNKNFNLN